MLAGRKAAARDRPDTSVSVIVSASTTAVVRADCFPQELRMTYDVITPTPMAEDTAIERLLDMQAVGGSIPLAPSIFCRSIPNRWVRAGVR